jgi:thiosulfate/3-mercaptopyruvate sulfurtransferase
VIVYDTLGIFSAPRVWWMFRVFGHEKVSVLNGGLPAWQGKGYPTTSGDGGEILPVKFQARLRPDLVRNYGEIKSNCALAKEQLVDFRSSARFRGEVAEHFPGVKPGHIPGSKNLPYTELLAPNNEMKNKSDIKSEYQKIHVDLDKPITTTCGSGVTACIGALSLFELGIENVAVYDGSYTEWGQTV